MREVQSLARVCVHPNIVRLHEIHLHESRAVLVFDFLPDGSLHDLIQRRPSTPPPVLHMLSQVLAALVHVHARGWMHRDIKPENILLRGTHCSLADFSLARRSDQDSLTQYVSTRWYRAPELLLAAPNYHSAIDLFAVGCVAAELYTYEPLFPGDNEIDQLQRIFSVLGFPTEKSWPRGFFLMQRIHQIRPSQRIIDPRDQLRQRVPSGDQSLLLGLLALHPERRWTAEEAFKYCKRHANDSTL